jgi:SAM-dependent methyltransferase
MTTLMNQTYKDILLKEAGELWPKNFSEYEKLFNQACFSIALKVMKDLDLFQKKEETLTFYEIKNKMKLADQAEYLVKKLLQILVEEDVLSKNNESYKCSRIIEIEGPTELLTDLTRRFPAEQASFRWVARAYDGMLDFIKGKAYPEDIMFPWGSFELVEDVYNTSQIYGFYSKLAGLAVKKLIEEVYQRKIKILEVGAGTGNGTRNVLELSAGNIEMYDFTDISKSLIKGSAKKFSYDFMKFKLFDLMKSSTEQEFELNSYDLILAVNVLHAAGNAAEAIRSLYQLLNQHGALVISEISPPEGHLYRYMELTFGLLPSYSGYKDKEERPSAPIIRPDQWIKLYHKAGFKDVFSVPEKEDPDNRGGVIIGFK